MIREIIKPKDTNLTINIPEDYVGKEIEYIVFPLESKISYKKNNSKNISSLKGILSKYANPSKTLQEDSAWKDYIQEKFKN